MDKASEALFALKPVTFRYKAEVDPARSLAFGLIAEDVAEISPELITRDENGNPQTVRYEAIDAMLLNEFLKEYKKVHEQGAAIAQQRKDFEAALTAQRKSFEFKIAEQAKRIEVLASGLQKVSAQLELINYPPRTVAYDR